MHLSAEPSPTPGIMTLIGCGYNNNIIPSISLSVFVQLAGITTVDHLQFSLLASGV
jgi:hypothetical protein